MWKKTRTEFQPVGGTDWEEDDFATLKVLFVPILNIPELVRDGKGQHKLKPKAHYENLSLKS